MTAQDDEWKQPDSLGFWRRNEIDALRITFEGVTERLATTPEDYELIQQQRRRLATLEARQQQVFKRYLRIQAR